MSNVESVLINQAMNHLIDNIISRVRDEISSSRNNIIENAGVEATNRINADKKLNQKIINAYNSALDRVNQAKVLSEQYTEEKVQYLLNALNGLSSKLNDIIGQSSDGAQAHTLYNLDRRIDGVDSSISSIRYNINEQSSVIASLRDQIENISESFDAIAIQNLENQIDSIMSSISSADGLWGGTSYYANISTIVSSLYNRIKNIISEEGKIQRLVVDGSVVVGDVGGQNTTIGPNRVVTKNLIVENVDVTGEFTISNNEVVVDAQPYLMCNVESSNYPQTSKQGFLIGLKRNDSPNNTLDAIGVVYDAIKGNNTLNVYRGVVDMDSGNTKDIFSHQIVLADNSLDDLDLEDVDYILTNTKVQLSDGKYINTIGKGQNPLTMSQLLGNLDDLQEQISSNLSDIGSLQDSIDNEDSGILKRIRDCDNDIIGLNTIVSNFRKELGILSDELVDGDGNPITNIYGRIKDLEKYDYTTTQTHVASIQSYLGIGAQTSNTIYEALDAVGYVKKSSIDLLDGKIATIQNSMEVQHSSIGNDIATINSRIQSINTLLSSKVDVAQFSMVSDGVLTLQQDVENNTIGIQTNGNAISSLQSNVASINQSISTMSQLPTMNLPNSSDLSKGDAFLLVWNGTTFEWQKYE